MKLIKGLTAAGVFVIFLAICLLVIAMMVMCSDDARGAIIWPDNTAKPVAADYYVDSVACRYAKIHGDTTTIVCDSILRHKITLKTGKDGVIITAANLADIGNVFMRLLTAPTPAHRDSVFAKCIVVDSQEVKTGKGKP